MSTSRGICRWVKRNAYPGGNLPILNLKTHLLFAQTYTIIKYIILTLEKVVTFIVTLLRLTTHIRFVTMIKSINTIIYSDHSRGKLKAIKGIA
jgi:hypothetical protein